MVIKFIFFTFFLVYPRLSFDSDGSGCKVETIDENFEEDESKGKINNFVITSVESGDEDELNTKSPHGDNNSSDVKIVG